MKVQLLSTHKDRRYQTPFLLDQCVCILAQQACPLLRHFINIHQFCGPEASKTIYRNGKQVKINKAVTEMLKNT